MFEGKEASAPPPRSAPAPSPLLAKRDMDRRKNLANVMCAQSHTSAPEFLGAAGSRPTSYTWRTPTTSCGA